MGLSFELQGKAARDIVQTTFILNGERHHYFNQQESLQRFSWPGRKATIRGASLSWTSVHTGERLFGDYQGTWGLIRLLEKPGLPHWTMAIAATAWCSRRRTAWI
ncbi:unnamed protein product, partial [Mesorhabditis spiculigera]